MYRILQICGTAEGGTWFISQVKELTRRGHVVEAVVPGEGSVAQAMRDLSVEVHVIPFRGYRLRDIRRHISSIRSMRALIRSGRFDIVHAHLLKSYILARLLIRRNGSLPSLISQVPGNAHLQMPLLRLAERLTLPFDGTTVVSCTAFVEDFRNLGARRTDVVRYGLDTTGVTFSSDVEACRDALGLLPSHVAIGMVAHMYPTRAKAFQGVGVKGHETFIDAAALACARDKSLRFFIVGDEFIGDGRYRRALEERARLRGVPISFLGNLQSMHDFLPAMNILSNPSVSESASYTVIEAGLAGRPVAATAVGGLTDSVVNGRTGLLVPPKDAEALANSFLLLARDAAMRERLGSAAIEHVRCMFDIQVTTSELERVYCEVSA